MITREIKTIDGKIYMVTTQEITPKYLEKLKLAQQEQIVRLQASISEIDKKLPDIKE